MKARLPRIVRMAVHALVVVASSLPGYSQTFNPGKNMLNVGDTFPLARLTGKNGPLKTDSSRFSVLYFYPKDKTPGCTIEAGEFQKLKSTFDENNIRIIGISVDDANSHAAFCEAMSLTFELATDENGKLGDEMGILAGGLHKRVTFVINKAGKIVLVYPTVKPAGHAQQILTDIAALPR